MSRHNYEMSNLSGC